MRVCVCICVRMYVFSAISSMLFNNVLEHVRLMICHIDITRYADQCLSQDEISTGYLPCLLLMACTLASTASMITRYIPIA